MSQLRRIRLPLLATALACCALLAAEERTAEACGCVHPPEPEIDSIEEFAVNQSSEQIIFEVEEGFVTAHVLIQYFGKPSEFAWVVPVPSVPELSLSSEAAFSLLARDTAPQLTLINESACPIQEWACEQASRPNCSSGGGGCGFASGDDGNWGASFQDAGGASSSDGGQVDVPPVDIIERDVIGAYETVVFAAGDVEGTMQWLRDEGFIVNSSMAPFIQSYSDANMLFLASKLVPGATTTDIKPLRMRFAAEDPMIPLQMTAVAAEPDMTITAYVYADQAYAPRDTELAQVDPQFLSADSDDRMNYPMLLSRAIDDAGGKSFVAEYAGSPIVASLNGQEPSEELSAGVSLINELAKKHRYLTRLTTRMSAADMTYDPVFVPSSSVPFTPRLELQNQRYSLESCETDIIDTTDYAEALALADCASLYCGTGTCVATAEGVGCDCEAGTVARRFIDLDGRPSTTCVPDTAPVDFSEGGLKLRDACATVNCGSGTCVDVGGFPTCQCDDGFAGIQSGLEAAPVCHAITTRSTSPGAENISAALLEVPVCAPAPPSCGDFGWNVPADTSSGRRGVQCATSVPSEADLETKGSPSCEDLGLEESNSGCSTDNSAKGAASMLLSAFVFFLAFRRRRERGVE